MQRFAGKHCQVLCLTAKIFQQHFPIVRPAAAHTGEPGKLLYYTAFHHFRSLVGKGNRKNVTMSRIGTLSQRILSGSVVFFTEQQSDILIRQSERFARTGRCLVYREHGCVYCLTLNYPRLQPQL